MGKITDIWFRTDLGLEELTHRLGLTDIVYDFENVWEWATGDLNGMKLNISRTHLKAGAALDTNIMLDRAAGPKQEFPEAIQRLLVLRLKSAALTPVFLGELTVNGNDEIEIVSIAEEVN